MSETEQELTKEMETETEVRLYFSKLRCIAAAWLAAKNSNISRKKEQQKYLP